ncbi:hypothetical protein R3P38DRAFT_2556549 [Favolaschia claudopus]|uniref:Uncharacterized protein n=1 Tax=Favolaschia claudopus TaxID=2862362 RepID=A0AAW0A900_9AGAR
MDSDDYFDDIVLDDQTLAVLDSEERKYLSQAPPPPKRQKTDNGWRPAPPIQLRGPPLADDNDLPEISVHGDGSYAVRGGLRNDASSRSKPQTVPPRAANGQPSRVPPRAANVPVATRSNTSVRPQAPPRRESLPSMQTRGAQAPRPVASTISRPPPPPPPPVETGVSKAQAEEMQRQIAELQKENEKFRTELKAATTAKFAKQGEVSILRQKEEKVAQEHATQVAQLKLAKEESEARQIAMQKELKAEMERLKTQFIFKQHEMETSSRKPPGSLRPKRISKDVLSTPVAASSQMQGWNKNLSSNRFPDQSPSRSRAAPDTRRTPEKFKKPPKLLGFENSFADATPIKPYNGPGRPKKEFTAPPSPIPFPPLADVVMSDPSDFVDAVTSSEPVDLERPVAPIDDLQEIEPFNWKAELTRLVLTHSSPQDTAPTLKILVGLDIPLESTEEYSTHVTRLLELLASTAQHKDYETSLQGVCRCLISLAVLLNKTNLENELAVLLNLLMFLCCSLPMFGSTLISPSHENGDDCDILDTLCSIIHDHLVPTKVQASSSELGGEAVGLLEALCWNMKDDLVNRLTIVCDNKEILMVLLDNAQPPGLLERSIRLLAFLASHSRLCRPLLSNAETPNLSDEAKAKAAAKHPLVERLCSFLTDVSRQDPEVSMKSQILTFFGVLAAAHPDVHAALVGYQALIPSLVAFLTQMATLLWEGDEFLMTSSAAITSRTIRTLNQTLFLLHHLVFGLEPNVNLRHRLHYAPSRTFNGITHMFIVTFGRLSCADPPEWIDAAQKFELEALSEMAQDLLDLVVDGPEADSIWAAYQLEPGDVIEDSDTDEEDMEAKLVGTNT